MGNVTIKGDARATVLRKPVLGSRHPFWNRPKRVWGKNRFCSCKQRFWVRYKSVLGWTNTSFRIGKKQFSDRHNPVLGDVLLFCEFFES